MTSFSSSVVSDRVAGAIREAEALAFQRFRKRGLPSMRPRPPVRVNLLPGESTRGRRDFPGWEVFRLGQQETPPIEARRFRPHASPGAADSALSRTDQCRTVGTGSNRKSLSALSEGPPKPLREFPVRLSGPIPGLRHGVPRIESLPTGVRMHSVGGGHVVGTRVRFCPDWSRSSSSTRGSHAGQQHSPGKGRPS